MTGVWENASSSSRTPERSGGTHSCCATARRAPTGRPRPEERSTALSPDNGCVRFRPWSPEPATGSASFQLLFLRIYGASRWQGISGKKSADPRHKPKEEVFAVGDEDEALVFTAGEIEAAGRVETMLRGEPVSIQWDAALKMPRAYGPEGDERVVVPMFWFAAARHYARVKTLVDQAPSVHGSPFSEPAH